MDTFTMRMNIVKKCDVYMVHVITLCPSPWNGLVQWYINMQQLTADQRIPRKEVTVEDMLGLGIYHCRLICGYKDYISKYVLESELETIVAMEARVRLELHPFFLLILVTWNGYRNIFIEFILLRVGNTYFPIQTLLTVQPTEYVLFNILNSFKFEGN